MKKMKIVIDGIKFGMLLQLAIGPVSLFIFNDSNSNGLVSAELAVIAVAIVDFIFVLCAITGITSFLNNERMKNILKYFGAIILTIFGSDIIASQYNYTLLSSFSISYIPSNSFIKGLLITGSNPLTILFWSGIFSLKVNTHGYHKYDMYYFGTGAVMATLIFLSFVAIMGIYTSELLSKDIIKIINIAIGILFILFSIKLILKKTDDNEKNII